MAIIAMFARGGKRLDLHARRWDPIESWRFSHGEALGGVYRAVDGSVFVASAGPRFDRDFFQERQYEKARVVFVRVISGAAGRLTNR